MPACIIPREAGVETPVVSATQLREEPLTSQLWHHVPPGSRGLHSRKVCLYRARPGGGGEAAD